MDELAMLEQENKTAIEEQKKQAAVVSFVDNGAFGGSQEFALAQRMAMALSKSTIVPKDYQGNMGNTLIAIEMANRLHTSPLMVMQHLYIVNGRPAWSSQYIIAAINASKKYKTELQYDMKGSGDTLECTAWVEDYNGHKVVGPTITMKMAKEEGWVSKNGSKWRTMPEVMIRYRAASFFGRLNCPDMIMGIYSADEAVEMGPDEYREIPLEPVMKEEANKVDVKIPEDMAENINRETGEVLEPDDLP